MIRTLTLVLTTLLVVAHVHSGKGSGVEAQPAFDLAKYESKLERLARGDGNQELVEGVTVSKLQAAKRIDREKCSKADLFERWFTCEMLKPKEWARSCCIHYLDRAVRFCARETLGQNPDQFDHVRRPIVKWSRLRYMNKRDQVFWTSILKFAEGNPEAMSKHLSFGLVPESDELDKEQRFDYVIDSAEIVGPEKLQDMLTRVRVLDVRTTLAVLSRAKDKETTEVVEGVTVADLIKMNDISHHFCQPDELIKRNKQCLATKRLISVRHYCKTVVRTMALKCPNDFDDEFTDYHWWLGVYDAIVAGDIDTFMLGDGESKLEKYLLKDPEVERARFVYIMSDQYREDRNREREEKRERERLERESQSYSESETDSVQGEATPSL